VIFVTAAGAAPVRSLLYDSPGRREAAGCHGSRRRLFDHPVWRTPILLGFALNCWRFRFQETTHLNGAIGGVQVGYNWLTMSNWILSFEAVSNL
jgi:hypothetical protein